MSIAEFSNLAVDIALSSFGDDGLNSTCVRRAVFVLTILASKPVHLPTFSQLSDGGLSLDWLSGPVLFVLEFMVDDVWSEEEDEKMANRLVDLLAE